MCAHIVVHRQFGTVRECLATCQCAGTSARITMQSAYNSMQCSRITAVQFKSMTERRNKQHHIHKCMCIVDLCAKNSSRAARHLIHISICISSSSSSSRAESTLSHTSNPKAYDGWNEETYRKSKL